MKVSDKKSKIKKTGNIISYDDLSMNVDNIKEGKYLGEIVKVEIKDEETKTISIIFKILDFYLPYEFKLGGKYDFDQKEFKKLCNILDVKLTYENKKFFFNKDDFIGKKHILSIERAHSSIYCEYITYISKYSFEEKKEENKESLLKKIINYLTNKGKK